MRFANYIKQLFKKDTSELSFFEYKKQFSWIYNLDLKSFEQEGNRGLVSVILPVFNGEAYIKQAIDSVLNQTYKNFELIIVDDGSFDQTPEIISSYQKSNKNIKICTHQQNKNLPSALNSGHKIASGEYITWISHDNILKETFLEKFVLELEKYPDTAMIYGNMQIIDQNGDILKGHGWFEFPILSGNVILPTGTENYNTVPNNTIGAAFMYRKAASDFIGKYNQNLFGIEDYDFFMRMNEIFTIRHTDEAMPLYYYRFHDKSLTSKDKEMKITENRPRLMSFDKFRREELLKTKSSGASIYKRYSYTESKKIISEKLKYFDSLKI